jgi:mycothiol synthase
MDDLEPVLELVNACYKVDYNEYWSVTEETLRNTWQSSAIHLETDSWVVIGPSEHFVGYALYQNDAHEWIDTFVYVLPGYRGRGIETYLLQMIEVRAQVQKAEAPPDTHFILWQRTSARNEAAQSSLEHAGYTLTRSFNVMEIEMDGPPPVPKLLEGMIVRTFIPGQDEWAAFEADEEAFQDDRDHTPRTFEEWERRFSLKQENFEPTLWFLAWHGNELAGLLIGTTSGGIGWVDHLGIRRPWRGRGLGMALLLRSFAEFYQRGMHKVGLNVDAESLTGANRVYERAGMRTVNQYHIYKAEFMTGDETK